MKVVIPVLGHGSRFKSENYELPKQLLPLSGETAITYSLSNIICNNEDKIFLLRKDVCDEFFLDKKIEEAEESQIYTNKDLADLVGMAHKIRMDELKAQTELEKAKAANIKSQTNVQINSGELPFGQGNYGELMKKLLKEK